MWLNWVYAVDQQIFHQDFQQYGRMEAVIPASAVPQPGWLSLCSITTSASVFLHRVGDHKQLSYSSHQPAITQSHPQKPGRHHPLSACCLTSAFGALFPTPIKNQIQTSSFGDERIVFYYVLWPRWNFSRTTPLVHISLLLWGKDNVFCRSVAQPQEQVTPAWDSIKQTKITFCTYPPRVL